MPRGGARPGAGRKPKSFHDARRRWEKVFFDSIDAEDVKIATMRWIAKLKAGDPHAAFLWDRLLGKVVDKSEAEHTGKITIEVEYVHQAAPAGPAPGPGADQG